MSHCGWPGCGCTGRNVCTAASPDSTVRAEPVLGWRMMGLALEKKWPLSLSLSFWGAWGEGDRWVSCLPGRPRIYVLQDDLDLPSSPPAPSVYCWDYRHAPSHLSDGSGDWTQCLLSARRARYQTLHILSTQTTVYLHVFQTPDTLEFLHTSAGYL